MKKLLCAFGIHWRGRSDGGGMGDAYQCHVCGYDSYTPTFIVHDEAGKRDWDAVLTKIGLMVALPLALLGASLALIVFAAALMVVGGR